MKKIFLCLALVACSAEPKTPAVCQQNLQYCLSAYDSENKISHKQWSDLCQKDLGVCKAGWGQQ